MSDKSKTDSNPRDPETSSHIPIHSSYTPSDMDTHDHETEVGYPGQYPFTRGVQANMYRGRLWTMRQYAGMGDAAESNKRYKYLLAHGTTGLSVAFDLPTQIGLDSDHPLAIGEVGKVGVAIDSIEDMLCLFDGIDLTKTSTSMTINATAAILLALYVAVARRQGADIRKLSGTVQNDVLKEYIARGTYIFPPAHAMRDRFKAKTARSWMLRFHTQTAGSTLTAQQPENNIVRTALQALAAVLGGTQSLHTNSYDEALALPTEHAAQIALRTQQIVAYESGVPQTIDPLGGSYYLETLTCEIETRANVYLEKIEALGGMIKALERGYVQQEIQNAAYEYQQQVDREQAVVVGVNRFAIDQEKPIPIQRIDESLERKQVERLRALRLRRDPGAWQAALRQIEEGARSGSNLMPHILAAVEAYATVGEISDTMRKVFGEYKEAVVL